MVRISGEEWRNRVDKLLRLWTLRQRGSVQDDQIAKELGFLNTVGEPSKIAMYAQLEDWELPDWLVYPRDGGKPAEVNKERKASDTEDAKKRKARGTGEIRDLPPAGQAVDLFRQDLERLSHFVDELPRLKEQLQADRFVWSLWIGEEWDYYYRSEFCEEQWRNLCATYGEDPTNEVIRVPIDPIKPQGAGPVPWEGLVALIAVHTIMHKFTQNAVDDLVETLHPAPSSVDKANLYKDRGIVDTLRSYVLRLAKAVRGNVRTGQLPGEVPYIDHWVAWFLITPLAEDGYSDEQIHAWIKKHHPSLSNQYPVDEVARLRELRLPPPDRVPPETLP